jgi:hypothetical protein
MAKLMNCGVSLSTSVHATPTPVSMATLASSNIAARQEATFQVLTPRLGETIGLSEELGGADLNISITWTVPPQISERGVYIALVQGNNDTSLAEIFTVEGDCIPKYNKPSTKQG